MRTSKRIYGRECLDCCLYSILRFFYDPLLPNIPTQQLFQTIDIQMGVLMSQKIHCFVVASYCAITFLICTCVRTIQYTPPQPHGRFREWIRTNPTGTSTWGWSRGLCWGLRDIGEKETDDPYLISSLLIRLEPLYRPISQF